MTNTKIQHCSVSKKSWNSSLLLRDPVTQLVSAKHEICTFTMVTVKTGTRARKGMESFPRKGTQPSALEAHRPGIGNYLLTPSVA